MSGMIAEMCPNCGEEIEMMWDVERLGYQAFCPVCGGRLMLCDECIHDGGIPGGCDYDGERDHCRRQRGEGGIKLENKRC